MKVGLYIETKMYAFYKSRGLDIAEMLFNVLKKYDLETVEKSNAKLPIIVECFEKDSLTTFGKLSDLPLVYLMFYDNPNLTYNLTEISTFAHGVGPKIYWLFNYDGETLNLDKPSKFIEEAHSLGLGVHPYILQDDTLVYTKNPIEETKMYMNKMVDGIFTEFPHMTYSVYTEFKSSNTFPKSYIDAHSVKEDTFL